MDHVSALVAAKASRNEVSKLAKALDAIHPLVEVDVHLAPPDHDGIDTVWLWTPWNETTEKRCDRAIRACIGWIGSRAVRVRGEQQLVVLGAEDQSLYAIDITWPGRKILPAKAKESPTRPASTT
jgi:hypothetical protein